MMFKFIMLIILGSIIGIQIGVYLILKQKSISSVDSFLFSFSIYLIPFLIIAAHLDLYKDRHTVLKDLISKSQLTQEKQRNYLKLLDTKKFLILSLIMMIKDLLTPKDNLILVVKAAEFHNSKKSQIKQKRIKRQGGIVGVVRRATTVLRGNFVTHASEQFVSGRIGVN